MQKSNRHSPGAIVAVEPFSREDDERTKAVDGIFTFVDLVKYSRHFGVPVDAELLNALDVAPEFRRGVHRIYPGGRVEQHPNDKICPGCGARIRAKLTEKPCNRCAELQNA